MVVLAGPCGLIPDGSFDQHVQGHRLPVALDAEREPLALARHGEHCAEITGTMHPAARRRNDCIAGSDAGKGRRAAVNDGDHPRPGAARFALVRGLAQAHAGGGGPVQPLADQAFGDQPRPALPKRRN